MQLELKRPEDCMFDEISLGEIMLRLDPGAGSSLTAGAKTGDYQRITDTARKFVENIKAAREGR